MSSLDSSDAEVGDGDSTVSLKEQNGGERVAARCSTHVTAACLSHTPSHRSTQLCVVGTGMNLDGVVASMVHEEFLRHGPNHIFAVVLPDRADKRLTAAFARSVKYQLGRFPASPRDEVLVHVIKEGTSTKERCQMFFKGGVVVTTSKTLCADLLHRRLAAEVVALCVVCFPSVGFAAGESFLFNFAANMGTSLTNLAFCVEILLRGCGAGAGALSALGNCGSTAFSPDSTANSHNSQSPGGNGASVPKIVLLSDHPLWMQYLVNRHALGRERFTSLLHVGDIQLFPRFRLSLVQHFEKLSKAKTLVVDRTLVSVSNDVTILDNLLKRVLQEALSGLQSLQRRLEPARVSSSSSGNAVLASERRDPSTSEGFGHVDDFDADLRRLQPRVRARFEVNADGKGHHIEYESKYGRTQGQGQPRSRLATSSLSPWRDPLDANNILFAELTQEDAQETETAELDTDLAVALERNGPQWPFKDRVESLLDVRRLRRALHFGTQYDFVFTLSNVLEKRTPRQRPGDIAPPPPSAPWTLSQHFGDIVTVSTHRIGRIVERPATAAAVTPTTTAANKALGGTEASTMATTKANNDVIDVDDADVDEDVVVEGEYVPSPPNAATSTLTLVPNEEEQDNHLHRTHRLTIAWIRDQRRKLAKQAASSVVKGADPEADPPSLVPAMLIVVFGPKEVQAMMRRLRYSSEEFRQRQLADFVDRYQRVYGVKVLQRSDSQSGSGESEKANTPRRSKKETSPTEEGDIVDVRSSDIDDEEEDETSDPSEVEGFYDAEAVLQDRAEDGVVIREGVQGPRQSQRHELGNGGGLALHHLLLTQTTPAPTTANNGSPSGDCAGSLPGCNLQLEYNSSTLAVLVANYDDETGESAPGTVSVFPHVVVVDGNTMRPGELLAMVQGDHRLLQRLAAAEVGSIGTDSSGTRTLQAGRTGAGHLPNFIAVRRVILTRQSVSILRQMEILQDELDAPLLKKLKVHLVATTFSAREAAFMVEKEKAAFQSLANAKATLTGRMLMDRSSVRRTQEMLEAGLAVQSRSAAGSGGSLSSNARAGNGRRKRYAHIAGQFVGEVEAKKPDAPLVIFDEREFRSMLPFYLYLHGMDLVPLTLNTADYVLSSQYGVERKSVSDFFQSIMGHGRINEQLTALSRRYHYPALLIEFDRGRAFRLVSAPPSGADGAAGSHRSSVYGGSAAVYHRIAKMVASHPQVSILWSRSPAHSAGMMSTLKLTVAEENPDPSDSSLTGGLYAGTGDGVDDDPESEAARAIRHYATRVLARFPGVNDGNADAIMRLCGSLAGLAEITKDSLINTIGDEDGERLFAFLHSPFAGRR